MVGLFVAKVTYKLVTVSVYLKNKLNETFHTRFHKNPKFTLKNTKIPILQQPLSALFDTIRQRQRSRFTAGVIETCLPRENRSPRRVYHRIRMSPRHKNIAYPINNSPPP